MNNYTEIIEKFISNELEGEKLDWFQDQLRNNKDFVAQYILHIDINAAIKEDDIMHLRKRLDEIYNSFVQTEQKVIKISRIKQFSAAALILVLIGIAGLIFILKDKSLSNEELFADYYSPYETIINVRSADNEIEKLISDAFELYEQKKYKEASIKFDEILTQDPDNTFINFYSAISDLEIGNVNVASKKFQSIINDRDNLFVQQSEWYLSLCHIKQNQTDEAVKILKRIIEREGYYKKQAENLLAEISF